jgi:acetate kinase
MASRILSKSTSDGVKRWTEPNNVLGASVDAGSSTLKQVVLGLDKNEEQTRAKTETTATTEAKAAMRATTRTRATRMRGASMAGTKGAVPSW